MKLATYSHDGATAAGVVSGDRVHPVAGASGVLDLVDAGLPEALRRGAEAVDGARPVALADVRLLAPLRPRTLRDS